MLKQHVKNNIHTSCKDCVFAQYEDITQISCLAKQLDLDSPNLISAYDEEKEFYVLNGIVCPYYRTDTWRHKDAEDKVAQARLELKMNYDVVICHEEGDLEKTLSSILKQEKKPSRIHIITKAGYKPSTSILGLSVPWNLVGCIEMKDGAADRFRIKTVLRGIKSPIICYVNSGSDIPNIFDKLEDNIIDKQFQFGMIRISKDEFIVPRTCYEYYNFVADENSETICSVPEQEGIYELCQLNL